MGPHHAIDHRQPLDDGLKAIGIPQVRYVAGLTATDKHQKAIIEALAPQGALAMIEGPAFRYRPVQARGIGKIVLSRF